jgi:hypothetical protein
MNKKELKQLIKPLVKECINEVLLQEGVLSSIISEVMIGTQGAVLQEQVAPAPQKPTRKYETDDEAAQRLHEKRKHADAQRKKLMNAIGRDSFGGVDLFEGTQPLNSGGTPDSSTQAQGALSGYAPDDAGVNIDGLLNIAGSAWKKMK